MSKILLVNKKTHRVNGELRILDGMLRLVIKNSTNKKIRGELINFLKTQYILVDRNRHYKRRIKTND